jgi:hypothetical protein
MRPTSLLLLATAVACSAPAAGAAVPRPAPADLLARAGAWPTSSVVAVDDVKSGADAEASASDLLALYLESGDAVTVRVSLVAPRGIHGGADHYGAAGVRTLVLLDEGPGGEKRLPAPLVGDAPFAWERAVIVEGETVAPKVASGTAAARAEALEPHRYAFHLDRGWMAASLPAGAPVTQACAITYTADGRELDRLVSPTSAQGSFTNVAFVHHGNQGLAYSDVFAGRAGAEANSGYDEILRKHEQTSVPGNFHLGALLQSSAEWNRQNGDPLDFNGWLRAGVTAGWAGMITSAYGQPIMPFLQGAMNDWAISRDHAMVQYRYNYDPNVAWVPERVFLDPGTYPNAGVIDWSGAHWQGNGVGAVILDDWPHCAGHDKHRIHFLQGNGLRIVPRDGDFTGKLHTGDGAGALAILAGEAAGPNGQYRITVYADDWEMAAAVGGWENTFPYAIGTYRWMIDKCATESAWIHTWKLDPALANPDFNGDTFTPTYGTYGGIGDVNGYGGSNNAWYTHWAGFVPYSTGGNGSGGCAGGGNCKNHGQLWNDAHAALQAAPDNKIRETGWYVLMTNLHETGWHDYLGGPLSGWQRQYSAHIKNANVYAEAARWAGGLYANPTGCFFGDPDNDGNDELVMYNDRVMAVFESIGGRCTQLFAKGPGYDYSVVGIDNAYWAGTEGDYNDVNHVAALSDVGPNTQGDFYAMSVDTSSGNSVQATFSRGSVRKVVRLTLGQPYLDCVYRVGANTQYIQSGFSPDVVDLLYSGRMDRVWGGGPGTYMGQRNPNTAATAAYVLGNGGATHNLSFTSTLMKVDEIRGTQKFQFYLYAGATSAPNGSGQIAELEALRAVLNDQLPPEAQRATYFPVTRQLAITFDEPVSAAPVTLTGIRIDSNDDGVADVTLDAGCTVTNTGPSAVLTIAVSNAVHAAIQALTNRNGMELMLLAGAVQDPAGNGHAALTNGGNVPVSYGPPTLITLDGRFDASEWPNCTVAVSDSGDSQWNPPGEVHNEIRSLHATWDSTYLYLGVRGVATGNSWILYLDTDPGGANGQTNLTAIDSWERGASFTAPGFKPDWQLGAYQHQGAFDSQSFFKLLTATTSANWSDSVLKAFDPMHANGLDGGSELAIPWNVLYGLGAGRVPANAQIGLVASLCWDPEPAGQLGGDQAPNNLSATPPVIDNRVLVSLDTNGDGLPDAVDRTAPALVSAVPNGWDSLLTLQFSEPLAPAIAQQHTRYAVYQTGNPTASVTVRSATLLPGGTQVRLLVSGLTYVPYTVVASGIADASCFANVAAQSSTTFQGPPVAVDPTHGPGRTLELSVPRPNPSRDGRVTLAYAVPGGEGSPASVELGLYDLGGRRVRALVQGSQLPGRYEVTLDGRDDQARRLAPGVYFVRLSRGAAQVTRRLVVMP